MQGRMPYRPYADKGTLLLDSVLLAPITIQYNHCW
jgi:hypothetical protein